MDPTLPLAILGVAAAVAAFLYTKRRAPKSLALCAAVAALSGGESMLLGAGHVSGVVGRALSGHGAGNAPFTYDFRFYSLVLFGLLLVAAGVVCLAAIRGLARRSLGSWRAAFWSGVFLAAVNLPLAPIQGFAYILGGLALATIAMLLATRRFVSPPG